MAKKPRKPQRARKLRAAAKRPSTIDMVEEKILAKAFGLAPIIRAKVDFVHLEVEAGTPAEAANVTRALEATYGHLSKEQRASLRCVWNGRRSASLKKRNPHSLWAHTDEDRWAAEDWRREFPDSEFNLFRVAGGMTDLEQELAKTTVLEAHKAGCSTCAVIAIATYPQISGEGSIDFSDLRGRGWPESWQFNARWHFRFNRTWVAGHPTLEVVMTGVEQSVAQSAGGVREQEVGP